jgi:hypothetical protein
MFSNWRKEIPKEIGFYWFYGDRWNLGENEFVFCEVFKISNGVSIKGDGQFIFESEFGDNWSFKRIEMPEIPIF